MSTYYEYLLCKSLITGFNRWYQKIICVTKYFYNSRSTMLDVNVVDYAVEFFLIEHDRA